MKTLCFTCKKFLVEGYFGGVGLFLGVIHRIRPIGSAVINSTSKGSVGARHLLDGRNGIWVALPQVPAINPGTFARSADTNWLALPRKLISGGKSTGVWSQAG
jgi:hypothetical protein